MTSHIYDFCEVGVVLPVHQRFDKNSNATPKKVYSKMSRWA